MTTEKKIEFDDLPKSLGLAAVRQRLSTYVEELRSNAREEARINKTKNELKINDFIDRIKELNRLGFFNQGGKIDYNKIKAYGNNSKWKC